MRVLIYRYVTSASNVKINGRGIVGKSAHRDFCDPKADKGDKGNKVLFIYVIFLNNYTRKK